MQPVLKHLLEGLDFEEREAVVRRFEAMQSELKYLLEHKPALMKKAARYGWTSAKLTVVFCMNSFYQRILAPLIASSSAPSVVGSEIPIRYGESLRFDTDRNDRMLELKNAFLALCHDADIDRPMLEAQRTQDLIWSLANPRSIYNGDDVE